MKLSSITYSKLHKNSFNPFQNRVFNRYNQKNDSRWRHIRVLCFGATCRHASFIRLSRSNLSSTHLIPRSTSNRTVSLFMWYGSSHALHVRCGTRFHHLFLRNVIRTVHTSSSICTTFWRFTRRDSSLDNAGIGVVKSAPYLYIRDKLEHFIKNLLILLWWK